jgi:pimeloyl-ACP methyl ester carboxylesterase
MKPSALLLLLALPVLGADEKLQEGFADSGGVKIHYVVEGKGPLMVLIHGFPDFWYSWRHQMPELAKHYRVVAVDQRGYNKSDKPEGVDNYKMDKLVDDVRAVVEHLKEKKAIIVGHDWGGAVAWAFAMKYPAMTDKLIICNLPHPKGLARELKNNPKQQQNSAYARFFQTELAAKTLSPAGLTKILKIKDKEVEAKYLEAFKASSMEGMLNYYKANYPREPYTDDVTYPKVTCPVLIIHGLKDTALLPGALNNTWEWVDKDLTIVTVPEAGHWVQHDAPEVVNRAILKWLSP